LATSSSPGASQSSPASGSVEPVLIATASASAASAPSSPVAPAAPADNGPSALPLLVAAVAIVLILCGAGAWLFVRRRRLTASPDLTPEP
jgi:hypothetical protein